MDKFRFELEVCFDKTMENGTIGKATEKYLVDALSFADAETKITEELSPMMTGEFEVRKSRKVNLSDVVLSEDGDADKFFIVKIGCIMLDEKSGKEKITTLRVMVQAPDFRSAYTNFVEYMKGSMSDFKIISLSETKIVEYFGNKMQTAE